VGLQLLENAAATALGLYVLIVVLAPVSGAHFNPIVSLVDAALGFRTWRDVASYLPAQIAGCVSGAVLANTMFGLPAITMSTKGRLTEPHLVAEVVATAGLVLVIFALARTGRGELAPAAVAAYIGSAYFFTSSTSFANPAITIGRMFTDNFAGVDPGSATGHIGAQLVGGALGLLLVRALHPGHSPAAPDHLGAAASTPLRQFSEGKA
jgi:glycerol uptake facilitator-like aquaporin